MSVWYKKSIVLEVNPWNKVTVHSNGEIFEFRDNDGDTPFSLGSEEMLRFRDWITEVLG